MITESDVRIFDMMTFAVHNIAFINDLNNDLILEKRNNQQGPITKYYLDWCEKRLPEKYPRPLNPGTIWMYSSAIIISYDQRWDMYLPKTKIRNSDPIWGLNNVKLNALHNKNPSIRTVVRRIRNAIAHSKVDVRTGSEESEWEDFLSETTFIFRDNGNFELKISFLDLSKLCAHLYKTISPEIEKYMDARSQKE